MKKILLASGIFLASIIKGLGQETPNLVNAAVLSPTTEKARKTAEEDVDIFSGVPQIGVPIYSYSNPNNGLSLNISLSYFAGGIQVAEAPTNIGLGWYLNAGGIITRVVRGMADDGGEDPLSTYLFADTIPNDFRTYADSYYNDETDAEQDIFQYNFNGRSGSFYVGKNGQVAQVPVSKMKIIPIINTYQITGFRFITEDGVKYEFDNPELTTLSTYDRFILNDYYSSFSLSRIIAPFNTDTIQFNYVQKSITTDFKYPDIAYVRNSDGVRTKKLLNIGGNNISTTNKISSIIFPDKTTVSFSYGNTYYYGGDNTLFLIKVSDTTFRYGYILDYQVKDASNNACKPLLASVTPFTPLQKSKGYSFTYYSPLFVSDTIQNKQDYWGFYNGAVNDSTLIPNINGFSWGANRIPNISYAIANTLQNFYLPGGGYISYEYELNDHLPSTKVTTTATLNPLSTYTNTVQLNQVFNTNHEIVFTLDSSISRQGAPPISGTGKVTVYVKNTAGTVTYATYILSLYDLFYKGIQAWDFYVPNGYYQISQMAATGTTITGSFPIKMSWENKLADTTHTATASGGLRVKKITSKTGASDPAASTTEYHYVNADGTSSGFLGDIPRFDYPYLETVHNGSTVTTGYTVVSSDPQYTDVGGIAGYSRVEVYKGTSGHNSGKTVYEFTTPQDAGSIYETPSFPYAPLDLKSWGIGLPKKISSYDSIGTLVKKVTNSYAYDTSVSFKNKYFRSLKLGNSYTYIDGDPAIPSTPRTHSYIGREYYPSTGRTYLASTTDTLFQADGSTNASYTNFEYDTNYNVIKVISSYDKTRGLQLEKRFYYPYDYTIGGGVGKLRDSTIISPLVAEESWITGDATPRILSGNVTHYLQTAGGYVKADTMYQLQSNHPIPQSVIGIFNPALLNRNSTYFVPQSSFISYDSKGNLLQQQNLLSGVNNSIIMDYAVRYPVAKVSNAVLSDIAYTSFEADGTGNWTIASSSRDTTGGVTGKRAYNLTNGTVSKSGLSTAKTYLITVWAKTGATVKVNGVTQSGILATQGSWNFYSTVVSSVTTVTVSGTGLIDELRLHPKDANMVTYTYEPMIGVTATTDANNTIIYNEYDALNRLKVIRDKDKKILKRYDYSDSIYSITLAPIWTYSGKSCSGSDGVADSTYTDSNIYSETYGSVRHVPYTDYCMCAVPSGSHPDYKYISGSCQQAIKCITSSTYIKVYNPDNSYYWTWKCVWHYKWIDNSVSPDYYYYNSTSCPIGCIIQEQ